MKFSIIGIFLYPLVLPIISMKTTQRGWVWEQEDPYFGQQRMNSSFVTTPNSINFEECQQQCPSTSEYNPVCGTNNISYDNHNKLVCAQRCGLKVQKAYNGNCNGGKPSTTSTTQPTPNNMKCIQRCHKLPTYNPICGTNNVTYDNENALKCAQNCGVQVQKLFNGNCGNRMPLITSTTPISTSNSTWNRSPQFLSCLKRCTTRSVYQPVCGTDGVTYDNDSKIECDSSCGRNVKKLHNGVCRS